MQNYIEVNLRAQVDPGELLAMLEGGEALGSWERDGVLYIYWPGRKWTPAVLEDLKHALAGLGIDEREAGLTIRSIADIDWNATWAASLEPIRLGRRVRIRQSWHTGEAAFEGIELVIDPKRAFGTGYHETTRLLVEWLENHINGGERILDVGTGSGILAMTAVRLGAASALALDNDPVAMECARENHEVNGFGTELELRTASFEDLDSDRFDVIVANLDSKTLPLLCDALPRLLNARGIGCLSGLLQQDYAEIAEAAMKAGLRISARRECGDWLALEVRIPELERKTPGLEDSKSTCYCVTDPKQL
jgi:ribosomal protein L11 methyltransferase